MKWIEMRFTVPEDEAEILFAAARLLGLSQMDEDWCTEKREQDNATLDYAPIEEPSDRKNNW